MNKDEIKGLLQRYRMGLCTAEETAAIEQWYDTMAVSGEWSWTEEEKGVFESSLQAGIRQAMHEPVSGSEGVITGRRIFYLPRVAVAAAIILCIVTGGYFFRQNQTQKGNRPPETGKLYKNDVLPGGNKAILTLADGSAIVLDSAKTGTIAVQENTKITKLDNGRVSYQSGTGATAAVSYNRLSTPRGGQYQLILPDGSKVWLNAASSIRYPTAFTGRERRVEVSGEAYFEVVHMTTKTMPFIVSIVSPSGGEGNAGEVEVLGTHFNVNAYANEEMVKTTLLEGAVKLVKDGGSILLKPGQQAGFKTNGTPELIKQADADEAVAWRNGVFQFNEAGIETVMRQIERWYDVEVSYEGKKPAWHFSGTMNRNTNISQVLKILELSDVHFRIDGRRVIVLPG
ncbi:FecR family protein [Flavitalea flava]